MDISSQFSIVEFIGITLALKIAYLRCFYDCYGSSSESLSVKYS